MGEPALQLSPAEEEAADQAAKTLRLIQGGGEAAASGEEAVVAAEAAEAGWAAEVVEAAAIVAAPLAFLAVLLWPSSVARDEDYLKKPISASNDPNTKAVPQPSSPAQPCPDAAAKEKEKDEEPCPVCIRGLNPVPGYRPPYLYAVPPRCPKDYETIPPLNLYKRTNKIVHGARVYEAPNGNFYHVDTFHKGSASEVEEYDRRGRHLGAICPNCGTPIPGSQVPGRRLPD